MNTSSYTNSSHDDLTTETLFLATIKEMQTPVKVYLRNGIALSGKIKSFDLKSILLEDYNGKQLIFKCNIATILPSKSLEATCLAGLQETIS